MSYLRSTLITGLSSIMLSIMLAGCAGREAHPIPVRQPNDENRTCAFIENELIFTQSEISRLLPKTDKIGKNIALGITGIFFLVPWFFMDFSQAEQIEIDALRQRYNYLTSLYSEKKCGSQQNKAKNQ